jgi:alpha-glucosidase
MGTRARQLAMTVIYPSPLTVFCDSPTNYLGQPGIEFLRALPTVWDDSVVLSGEVGKFIVIARRSGQRWYLAAMTGDNAAQLQAPLKFLGKGKWTLHSFADDPGSTDAEAVVESTCEVTAKTMLPLSLVPGGGFAGTISPAK